jgi:hypothetical protein
MTRSQAAALWIALGGPPAVADTMAEIGYYESESGNDNAVSSAGCTGYYQICPPGPNSKNPVQNTREAIAKYRASGFEPWTCCSAGARSIVEGRRRNASLFLPGPPGSGPLGPAEIPLELGKEALEGKVPNPLNPLEEGVNTVKTTIGGVKNSFGAIEAFFRFLSKLNELSTWERIGKVGIGLFLLLVGVLGMANVSNPVDLKVNPAKIGAAGKLGKVTVGVAK